MSKKDTAQLRLSLSDAKGPLHQIITNLSGNKAERWLAELQRFLRQEETWTRHFPTYTSVIIGSYESSDELIKEVIKTNHPCFQVSSKVAKFLFIELLEKIFRSLFYSTS